MTRTPYYLENARTGYRLWDGKLVDGMVHDGLWDVVSDYHMGAAAEIQSKKFNISREEQDQFSFESNQKALRATREEKFKEEILPLLEVLHRGFGDSKYRPCPLLKKYVDAGYLGKKPAEDSIHTEESKGVRMQRSLQGKRFLEWSYAWPLGLQSLCSPL